MDLQSLFDQAMTSHRQGNLSQAEQLYRQLLQAAPTTYGAHYLLGVLQSQQGRSAEALASYDRALGLRPDFTEAQYNRGVLLWQMGRPADALKSYDKVVAALPKHAEAHYSRGVVLAELTRWEEAVEAYDWALAATPDFPRALGNRGVALWTLRLFDSALASYDRALALEPGNASTIYNRGLVLADMGRLEDAIIEYDRALAIAPDMAEALSSRGGARLTLGHYEQALADLDISLARRPQDVETLTNRGVALWKLKRPAEALAAYDRALAARPGFISALINRGQALYGLGRFPEALAGFERALAIEPNNADAWDARGSILRHLKRFEDAVASYDRAIALRPDFTEALNNRGYTKWANLGLFTEAVADMESALALEPDGRYLRGELLHLKMYGADWRSFEQQKALIDQGVREGKRMARPFMYQALSDSPADLQACSKIFAQDRFPETPALFTHAKRERKKIRLGYVSSDFREQATSYLMAGLYENHDKDRFEIVAFDNGYNDNSPMRARLEAAFDKFVAIAALPEQAAAEAVHAEEIDILVNLNGYFGAPRMEVFARRPAPVQVNYLGFPATLGAPYIDYIIADKTVIPAQERQYYSEQVVWLPDSYQANDSRRPIGPDTTRDAHGLPPEAFVFCNFNQSYKLTPATFTAWMNILKACEGSVLWLLDSVPAFKENLGREAEARGVARGRLIFAPAVPVEEHLARLKLADLFLDTLPYNAHTTASDALWTGLPLLTLRGNAFPGRVAASLLEAANLKTLIAKTPEEFEKLAIELAGDKPKLKRLRDKPAKNRLACPLFDTARFTRHIEAAYTAMWDCWQKGEKPRAFAVEPPA